MPPQPPITGLDRQQLAVALRVAGVSSRQIEVRTDQLWNELYVRGTRRFSEMKSLGTPLNASLAEHFSIGRPDITQEQISVDGTRKWLLRLSPGTTNPPGPEVETVYIPETRRGTLCISSQVGCSLSCSFCHTGTQKMSHNLTPSEILSQILLARDQLADYPGQSTAPTVVAPCRGRKISNIVMMGMGEPLFNFDNVKRALLIAMSKSGIGLSRRRITLSTSGVVPGIYRTGDELNIMLAISLHAVTNTLRDELVPINRKYPLEVLLKACREYPGLSNARRITFEYVMLKGVNDSLADARELVRLLANIPAKINLIPFNPWPGSPLECSEAATLKRFSNFLSRHGYVSPIRTTRGGDIMAACGQLKSTSAAVERPRVLTSPRQW